MKFEESNSLVKNIVEIDSLGKDFEKVFMKDSPAQDDEEKPKDDTNREVQDVEVELTQPLPKVWEYAISHPKDLTIGDVSKGVTTRSKPLIFVIVLHSFHILSPRTSSKLRATHIGCLQCKKSSINLSAIKFGISFLLSLIHI